MPEPMNIKDYIPARVLLLFALTALGGFFLLASSAARPGNAASCTMVIGYSVTDDWWSGGFETKVGNGDSWELLEKGGSSVYRVAYTEDYIWPYWNSDTIISRCVANSRLPDRIIYHAGYRGGVDGPPYGDSQDVLDLVTRLRARINPNAEIYLMGHVGSTAPDTCSVFSDDVAAASIAAIRGAIAIDPTIREAVHPVIPCSQFGDSLGHLSSTVSSNVAQQVADWVMSLGSAPTPTPGAPTPTPVPTATPGKAISGCRVRTTYRDGTTYSRDVAVSVCQGLE